MEALEREQEAIDQKASSLEKKLRAVMGGNTSMNSLTKTNNYFLKLLLPNYNVSNNCIKLNDNDIEDNYDEIIYDMNDGNFYYNKNSNNHHHNSSNSNHHEEIKRIPFKRSLLKNLKYGGQ